MGLEVHIITWEASCFSWCFCFLGLGVLAFSDGWTVDQAGGRVRLLTSAAASSWRTLLSLAGTSGWSCTLGVLLFLYCSCNLFCTWTSCFSSSHVSLSSSITQVGMDTLDDLEDEPKLRPFRPVSALLLCALSDPLTKSWSEFRVLDLWHTYSAHLTTDLEFIAFLFWGLTWVMVLLFHPFESVFRRPVFIFTSLQLCKC